MISMEKFQKIVDEHYYDQALVDLFIKYLTLIKGWSQADIEENLTCEHTLFIVLAMSMLRHKRKRNEFINSKRALFQRYPELSEIIEDLIENVNSKKDPTDCVTDNLYYEYKNVIPGDVPFDELFEDLPKLSSYNVEDLTRILKDYIYYRDLPDEYMVILWDFFTYLYTRGVWVYLGDEMWMPVVRISENGTEYHVWDFCVPHD